MPLQNSQGKWLVHAKFVNTQIHLVCLILSLERECQLSSRYRELIIGSQLRVLNNRYSRLGSSSCSRCVKSTHTAPPEESSLMAVAR
ncbi:hypothetical protein TNCV_1045371 [Trichonephila clavipes]|nr:hypothetical protein TNCV_1045371 [Trichonephila clavipes]